MSAPGWDAAGLLKPLWRRFPGGRDGLAAAAKTHGETLSAIENGRRKLGHALGERLAAALDVTLLELGAPAEEAPHRERTLAALLEEAVEQAEHGRALLIENLESIDARLSKIEALLAAPAVRGSRRR